MRFSASADTSTPKGDKPMNIELIPLSKLIPCPVNVRRTGRNDGIEELAASIKAHGLLQNLQVRAGAGGKFEVVAGQRRLAALKLLAKAKDLPKSAQIPCHSSPTPNEYSELPSTARTISGLRPANSTKPTGLVSTPERKCIGEPE
jgi:ParB-like nuclease domain